MGKSKSETAAAKPQAATEMSGAEMVVRALKDQGVRHIFGYPGGAVLPIYDALFQDNELVHVLVRHEQGAVHAAEGYARSTGRPGVVLVTSGPGATNAVTGLTDALMDSIPLVVITGQVATHLIGNDAFQECDTVGITCRICRACCTRRFPSPPRDVPARWSSIFPKTCSSRRGPMSAPATSSTKPIVRGSIPT
jgi:acetolactate synthase-1/2/3 large subunit